jgi:hypothetical protein
LLASYLLFFSYYSHSHEGFQGFFFMARLLLKSSLFAMIAFRDLHIHPRTIAYIPRSSKQTCSMARSGMGLVRGIGSRAGKQRFADRVRMGDLGVRMGEAEMHVCMSSWRWRGGRGRRGSGSSYAMLVLDITP